VINFDPITHTYTNSKGEKYESASQLINIYKKPFDVDFFSKNIARKRGISPEAVKEEWKKNTDDACVFGTNVHSIIESYLKTGVDTGDSVITEFIKVFPYKVGINSEKILWNDEYKIAGTSDIIVDVSSDCFDVLDVKTNKKFDFYNRFNECLLKPLDHLQNCKYSTYGLQLSLYAFMYSKITGKQPRQLAILYWNKVKFEKYYTPYMYWDINILLRHYTKQQVINN
jgi:hypothetical protein